MTTELLKLVNEKNSKKFKDWLAKIKALSDSVGTDPHQLPWSLDETASASSFELLGNPASAFAHLGADARLTGSGEAAKLDLYSTGERIALNPSNNLAILDVKVGLGGEASGSGNLGQAAAKFDGSLEAELRYRHYLPVRKNDDRATAYTRLIAESRLPNLLDLRKELINGEAHRLDAKMTADLGLDLEAGYSFAETTALELADGLASSFEFDMKASVMASLGLAFSSRMMLVAGAAGQRNAGWTRIRLQREKASRLSFGLTFALDLKYDLGTSLAQLFEDALDAVPTPRLVRTSREILGHAKNPERLKEKLAGEAGEVLEDLVRERIIDPLTGSAAVDKAIEFANQVVTFYDSLDGQVQGLWDRLLSKVDLDPASFQGQRIRGWLDQISTLDSSELPIDEFLDSDQKDMVGAVEALSGRTFEELVLTEDLEKVLEDAAALATKAKKLLDDTDDRILAKIREFNQKTGIDDLVKRLREVDSVDKLQNEACLRVKRAAEKLVGKALDQISAEDFDRIKTWAIKTDRYLSFADPDDEASEFHKLTKKIKGFLEEARFKYGLSVAFEFERLCRSSAVLDFEINPKARKKLVNPLSKSLRRGDVRSMFLAMLDYQAKADQNAENRGEEPPDLPFLLRECVFTSEKIRTTGLSSFFTMIGLGRSLNAKQSGRTQQVERSRIELRQSEGKRLGTFTTGLLRNDTTPEMAANAAVWLTVKEEGPLDLRLPYEGPRTASLRLVFSTEDAATRPTELDALEHLLADLGFETSGKRLPKDLIAAGAFSRFACEIRVPILMADWDLLEKVASFAGAGNQLDCAFLDATLRWLKEQFVTNPAMHSGRSIGQIVAHGVKLPWFVIHGRSSGALSGMPNKRKPLFVDGKSIGMSIEPNQPDRAGSWFIDLARRRGMLSEQISSIGQIWQQAKANRTDRAYESFSKTFGKEMRGIWVRGSRWPNPMFGFWFWVAAINELAPESLASARGFASFRGLGMDALADEAETWKSETYLLEGLRDNRGRIFKMAY